MELISLVGIFSVLLAGAVTAFLPCNYPMILGYVSLLVGDKKNQRPLVAMKITFWFFVGFAVTYATFGSVAGFFGQFSQTTLIINNLKPILTVIGGTLFLVIGFILLNVFSLPQKLQGLKSIPLPKNLSINSWWSALSVGVIFAAGWSPCIGPVLGGVLLLAGASGSVLAGMILLLLFSFGIIIPMLLILIVYVKMARHLSLGERFIPYARIVSGALFIFLGVLFVTGNTGIFETFIPLESLQRYL